MEEGTEVAFRSLTVISLVLLLLILVALRWVPLPHVLFALILH